MSSPVIRLRLHCELFSVNVRVREVGGRYLASADTPGGPSLGTGDEPMEAIIGALEPFQGLVDELLESLPRTLDQP